MSKFTVTNSSGVNLHFSCPIMYSNYKQACNRFDMLTYIELRNKYGIWASNQDKYVDNLTDLKPWDSTYEEEKLAEFLSLPENKEHLMNLTLRGRL